MYDVEVLFTDSRCAAAAREALRGTRFGMTAREIVTVESPDEYDRIAPFKHSQGVTGAVLGALLVTIQVGAVLGVLALLPSVDLTFTAAWISLLAGVVYGAGVGLLAGSCATDPDAMHMRRGIEIGHPVVRARFNEPHAAAFARSFLTSHPGAEFATAS